MHIEFKLDGASSKETFEKLVSVLDVLGRANILNHNVHHSMEWGEEYLEDITTLTYQEDGYDITFTYDKIKGKISLKSSKVKKE